MEKDRSGEIRMSTITIAISTAAMIIGIISVVMAGVMQKKISWVGVFVTLAMAFNLYVNIKNRKKLKDSMNIGNRL